MAFQRRHRYILLAAGIYWPLIFWLTHIPIPEIARRSGMSDKTMHWMAYLVLSFLTWLSCRPYEKVRWNRPLAWLIVLALAGYGAFDEWLQGRPFIGRSADWEDFVANLAGITIGLGILTFLSFWPALLTVSALFIFVIQNRSHLLILWPQYHLDIVFHFTAYAAFTLIWIHFLGLQESLRILQKIGLGLLLPAGLLIMVWTAAHWQSEPLDWMAILTALTAIVSSTAISFLVLGRKPGKRSVIRAHKDDTACPPDNRG